MVADCFEIYCFWPRFLSFFSFFVGTVGRMARVGRPKAARDGGCVSGAFVCILQEKPKIPNFDMKKRVFLKTVCQLAILMPIFGF